ncbi:YfbU family protein [Photobacterium arenosum]|uniref:YfbU family protein n=1 Tax=Photobacterium arenosum TaxID=2774143 RepID=UPI002889EF87|nr:YfbU family protein [Photobacterium arenosum]
MNLSKEQQLITLLLCEIHQALDIQDGLDSKLISKAITGGHQWALEWELEGSLIPTENHTEEQLTFVIDVLDMYDALEASYERFTDEECQLIADETQTEEPTRFPGFDGNNEFAYLSIAKFMVQDMEDRFTRFRGRIVNSHMPTTAIYERMLEVYRPLRPDGFPLTPQAVIAILRARIHPDNR